MSCGQNHKTTICYGVWFYYELRHLLGGHRKNKVLLNTANNGKMLVSSSTSRLNCLKRSPTCVRCGRVGVIWLLETTDVNRDVPHINLYAVDYRPNIKNPLIIMTQDHVMPKSKGGSNKKNNIQTMCIHCNSWKADKTPDQIEDIYGETMGT